MANSDRPRGFRPVGPYRSKAYQAGGEVFPGDLVRLTSSGQVVAVAAGETILGAALERASSGDSVLCAYEPEQCYEVQADESDISAQTNIGNNADVLATAGDSGFNTSRMELDSSTAAAAQAQLTILRVKPRPDNTFGAQVDVEVRINESQLRPDFTGV